MTVFSLFFFFFFFTVSSFGRKCRDWASLFFTFTFQIFLFGVVGGMTVGRR